MADFLSLQQVSKVFHADTAQQVRALDQISLTLQRGEFTVLSGPSGSGKTTLLNIIGTLDEPSSGTISLDGQLLEGLSQARLAALRRDHIGFIFQAYNLIEVLTARENIRYVMELQGQTGNQCETRVQQLASQLHISELLDKLPSQLSGGQQQRVAVARAVAARPKLILADEPTANLDSANGLALMEMMEQLNEQEGITIIFSSHDPLVISKARRSLILKDGRVDSDVQCA